MRRVPNFASAPEAASDSSASNTPMRSSERPASSRSIADSRQRPRSCIFVYSRPNRASASIRFFNRVSLKIALRSARGEPGGKADEKGFDRRPGGEIEQRQPSRRDEGHGDIEDLDLRGEPVDERERQI